MQHVRLRRVLRLQLRLRRRPRRRRGSHGRRRGRLCRGDARQGQRERAEEEGLGVGDPGEPGARDELRGEAEAVRGVHVQEEEVAAQGVAQEVSAM